jgi:hypothetical protein
MKGRAVIASAFEGLYGGLKRGLLNISCVFAPVYCVSVACLFPEQGLHSHSHSHLCLHCTDHRVPAQASM